MAKCQFSQTKVKYLGHIVSRTGVVIEPRKIEAMVTWSTPWTVPGAHRVLSLFHKGLYKDRIPFNQSPKGGIYLE